MLLDRLAHCAARAAEPALSLRPHLPRHRRLQGHQRQPGARGRRRGAEGRRHAARVGARPGDTVARIGGDEFTVLLEPLESPRDAERVAARLRQAVHGPVDLHGHRTEITTSVGIAFSSLDSVDPLELLRDADTAMYHAKRLGPGRQHVFDQAMHDSAMRRLRVESELRRALDTGGLVVHYQPIVNLETGVIEGFEGLARLTSSVGTLIGPSEFIPIAEAQGLVDRVLELVLEDAAMRVREWAVRHPSIYVSVNVSARSVHGGLLDQVMRVLARHQLATSHIKLELTESVLVSGSSLAIEILSALRARGIGLYIDDFGTGYSSLSYLHQFPADRIKLDRSFVNSLDGQRMPEIVQTIVTLSQRIGAEVIAEGIETALQLGALRRLGCTSGQGYLFAPALPPESATRLLEEARAWPLEAPASRPLGIVRPTTRTPV
ncbi:MAG: bifunctional diguanylate cyclase/phosphodiesterase [Myxococcota bacterium]